MTPQLEQLIKHYESLHDGDLSAIGLQPKMDCLGIWTEGWGAVIYDGNNRVIRGIENKALALQFSKIKTEADAQIDLASKVSRVNACVLSLINKNVKLKPNQLDAFVDLSYNAGSYVLKGTKTLAALNNGNFDLAMQMMLTWNKGVDEKTGKLIVLPGLDARCKSRVHLFKTGEVKFFN